MYKIFSLIYNIEKKKNKSHKLKLDSFLNIYLGGLLIL